MCPHRSWLSKCFQTPGLQQHRSPGQPWQPPLLHEDGEPSPPRAQTPRCVLTYIRSISSRDSHNYSKTRIVIPILQMRHHDPKHGAALLAEPGLPFSVSVTLHN